MKLLEDCEGEARSLTFSTVTEGPRSVIVSRDFALGVLVSPAGNCKSPTQGKGKGGQFPVAAVLRQSWGTTCVDLSLRSSLLCFLPPSVELLFTFPRDCASGLFGDMVASLGGVWSPIWGLLPVFYLPFY